MKHVTVTFTLAVTHTSPWYARELGMLENCATSQQTESTYLCVCQWVNRNLTEMAIAANCAIHAATMTKCGVGLL